MIILKVGGGKDINWEYIASDLKSLDQEIIIVHGANAYMKQLSIKLGIKEKIITSPSGHTSRFTDNETMEIMTMAYCGYMNKKIVSILKKNGYNPIGLSGADGSLWKGKKKDAIYSVEDGKTKVIRDCLTGNVIEINRGLILALLKMGYLPVLTVPAITDDGQLINVDNDRAVAVMAKDLKVEKIFMLFEAPGLLENLSDSESLINHIKGEELEGYIQKMKGRMKKKLLGVSEALSFGVSKIYFGDGRVEHPLQNILNGKGTVISK